VTDLDRGHWLAVAAVVAACSVYLPAISVADWVHDDHPAVVINDNVRWPPPVAQIFSTSYFGPSKAYAHMPLSRPLVTLSFCAEQALGLPVGARKGLQWLLYTLCALAALAVLDVVLRRFGWDPGEARLAAAAGAVLFALHPTHAGVVMSLAYRTEVLALLFTLLASWGLFSERISSRAGRVMAVSVPLALGLLCKESAVCALAPWALAGWLLRDRRTIEPLAAAVGVSLMFVTWRVVALGGIAIAEVPVFDNPLAHASAIERVVSAFSLVWLAASHLLVPVSLAPDYSFDALQLPAGWTLASAAGLIVAAATVAVGVGATKRAPLLSVALLFVAAFWAPVANLLFPIPVLFADRLLFAPSLAVCAVVAVGVVKAVRLRSSANGPVILAASAPAIILATLAVGGSFDWTDDQALYRRGVIAQPRSVKMQLNYGLNRLHANEPLAAVKHLEVARELAPRDHDVRAALLSAYAQTETCVDGRALVAGIMREKAAPRSVRMAMLKWALACREISLANELGRGLGLRRTGTTGAVKSPKSPVGDTR
jgi:protein O-mannosyl-transferase